MPLTRYQIRNEYSLADPELYRAADKNDPEALLEGVAMAGLVGLLRQLGDLAEFAAELFHNLHEEVMATTGRSHGLMNRLQQVEADIPSVEKAFLSHTSHKQLLYNAGIDWHPNLRMDQNMITRGDLPRFVMDSYEECRGPPRLFLLDKFDIAGAGACSKRYSDPSFFKTDFTSSEKTKTASHREKKARKIKRRASLCRNGEASEIVPTSNSKLHQLFLEENSQTENIVPIHHVKLKRRQSNCSVLDPTTGKSYMQKFLGTSSPESKAVYENAVSPLLLTMESGNSRELVPEIHEICTRSPDNKLGKIDRSPAQSPSKQDKLLEQSFDELIPDFELKNNPSTLYKVEDQKEFFYGDGKTEASTDGYPSDDVTSEMDNFVDALTTMESEMETDIENRLKHERGLNIEEKGEDIDTNEKQHKLEVQFSDTHSIGSSIAYDDGNNSFIQERFSLSYSNTISTSAEDVPLDDVAAKLYPTPETLSAGTVHEYSENLFDDGDALRLRSLDRVVPYGPCNQASEERSKFQLVRRSFVEVSYGFEEDEKNLAGNLPYKTNVIDLPFQSRDDLLPLDSQINQTAEMLDDGIPNKYAEVSSVENAFNVELDLPHSVTSPTNTQFHDLEKQELEAGSAIIPPECLPDAVNHDKLDGMKPDADGVVSEAQNVILSSGKKQEYLTSVKNYPGSNDFAEHKTLKMIDEVPPAELGSASAGFACSEMETSYNNLDGFSNTTACDVQDGPALNWVHFNSLGSEEKSDVPLDFPSEYAVSDIQESSSVIEVHSQLAALASGTSYVKADEEDSILDHNPIRSPSEDHINSGKCHGNGDSGEDELEITEITTQRHLNGPDAKKEPVVGCSDFNNELCDTQSDKASASKLLNNVNDPLLVERSQVCSNLSDDFNYPSSLRESDRQLASKDPPLSHLFDSSEGTKSSASHSPPELEAPLEQGLEIKADLLNVWSLHEGEDIEESSNHIDCDDCDEPSVSSYVDPLCQPSEPKFFLLPTSHKSERSEISEAIHEQTLDSAPSTPALDFSQPDHSALQANMEETTSLPPLPPKQRRVGMLQHGSQTLEGEGNQPSFDLFSQLSPATTDQKDQHGFPTLEGKLAYPLSEPTTDDERPQQGPKMLDGKLVQPCIDPLPSLPATKNEKIQQDTQTLERKAALPLDPFLSLTVMEQEKPQHGSLTSGIESLHPGLNPFQHSQYASLQQPWNSLEPPVREGEKPQNISSTLKGQMVQPPDSFARSTTTEDGKPEHGDLNTNGGMTWQWNSSVAPNVDDGKANEVLTKRIPRPRNPLVEEFVSRDKIMLRKVEERVLPQLRPKVAGRDSLLEQIRTKSFNLKPAVATRPSIKGPNTNLKVVAILEKANAIRQALAGSDDEDDDDDCWSDS